MESLTNNPVSNKKYLIQLEGHDDVSLRDADWYNEKRDKLFEKYPNAQVFEFSDYDENDVRNTDQYAISINGASGTSIRDDAWYQAKKDKLHSTYGSNVKVQRVRPVDYWADKAERYETVIKAIEDAIKSYSEQLEGAEEGTKEYDHIVSNLEFQREQLEKFKAEHEANPRVIEARAAEAEYRKQLPDNLRGRIAESRKPVYIESGNKIFEDEKGSEYGLIEKRTRGGSSNVKEIKTLEDIRDFGKTERKNILESDIESPRDMTSSMSPLESSKKEAEDIRSGKTNIPVDTISLNAAESFLDAYDYLENNKSSIAQGAWYSIWESVSQKDYDAVHTVLSKLEEKFQNLNDITAEQIDSVLSKEEKILLESYFLLAEEEAKTSNAFKGGQSAGESGKIMGEMLLWAAITYATGGAAAPAAGASITASLGKGAVKIGWNVVKGLGKWALKNAVKSVAFASLSPSSHKRMAQKQLQIGDNGRLMDETSDNIKYLAENATDYFSEFTGEGLASGFKYVKGLAKGSKFSNALSSFADTPVGRAGSYLWNSKGAKIMGNLGIQGIVPEAFEEFETAVLNEVLGLDENAIEDFFDKDNLGVTLISLSTISMLGAGVSTAAMINAPRKLSSAETRLRSALTPIVGEQRINDVVSQISSATTVNEIATALDGLAKEMGAGNLSKENIKLLTKYGEAAANYKTLFSGEFEGADESVKLYTDAYAEGQTMTEENLYDVNEAEQNARQAAIDSGAFDNGLSEDILNQSSADIASFLEEHKDELSDEATTALQNLAMAKSVKEGLDDSLRAAADDAVESYNDIATKCAKDNVLTIGMLDGKKVYIKTEREIENGTIVAPAGINVHMVEVIDSMTGESILVDSKLLSSVAKFDLEEYNTRMGNIIRDSFTQNWSNAQNTKSVASKLSDVTNMVGNKVLINTENGGMTEVEILQVLPEGNVIIKGKKGDLGGSSIQTVPVDAFYDSLSRDNNGNLLLNQASNVEKPTSSSAKNSVVDYRDGVYTLSVDGTTFDVEVTGQNDASNTITYEYTDSNGRTRIGRMSIDEFGAAIDNAANDEVAQVEETPAQPIAQPTETQAVEPQVEEPQAAPVQQEIDWDNLFDTDKNAYLSALQNEFGDEALDILNEEIADAQKKIDKLAKKDYSTQNERMASRKERAKLQERINALTSMIGSISPAVVEEPQPQPEAKVKTSNMRIGNTVLKEPKKPVVRRPRNAEPMTGIELAAKELGAKNGGLKLDLDSFLKHTGYSLSEANKFKGLFLPADKGGLTVEGAGDRLMEIDSEYNLNLLDQNDPMAGVNAILDAIQSNKSMAELRSYTARNRQADMQREADAVYSYLYEQYEAMLDEAHRDEIFGEELSSIHALTEEEYNELNAIFAEEINDYGTEDITGESDTLYETEDIGDLPVAEGEIYGGAEGSNQVLQETQPVQTRGEGNTQGRGIGNEVTGENAYSSVLNGDGSEVDFESSLEEDMPDFTTPEETLDNGYIVKDGKIINPTVIEIPNSPKEANRIFIAEKDGKWGYGWYATMDNGTSSWTDTIQLENLRYDSKEDAIKAALKYFNFYKNYRSNSKHGSSQLDAFVKYVNKAYLNVEAVAPNPVDNPIAEAQKLEKHLAAQLEKRLTDAHKQDLATSIGKKIGNLFATREDYDAYQEAATDFGKYNDNVEAGVDESFASRNQHQIGNEEFTESEATDLVNEAIDLSLEGSKIDVVRPAEEQTKDMLKLAGADPKTQWSIDADKPIFVSNAAVAVSNIKQEKATPEQWLKMLEKGGLKAAEDKWMGLSEWLKDSDKKTLTKQEVLDYINENTIRIEEVHYTEDAEANAQKVMVEIERTLNEKYHDYISEYYEENDVDDIYGGESQEYAIEKLREEMGDTEFPYTIENSGGNAWVDFTYEEVDELQKWADKLNIPFTPENPIYPTRINYISDGLTNNKEIALVVPTVESYKGALPEVHFFDAGEGRAVAWVRFGDAEIVEETQESRDASEALKELREDLESKYGKRRAGWPDSANAAYNALLDNQLSSMSYKKVLVLDEVQSQRHQDARENGYRYDSNPVVKEYNELNIQYDLLDEQKGTIVEEIRQIIIDKKDRGEDYEDDPRIAEKRAQFMSLSEEQEKIAERIGEIRHEVSKAVPVAPFEKNWHELAMKRMLRYAAENGYDAIAWTKGEQQAARYGLSKSVTSIEAEDNTIEVFEDGTPIAKEIHLYTTGGRRINLRVDPNGNIRGGMFDGNKLDTVVGKELAVKLMSEGSHKVEGEGLKVGGDGMKGFYDKMLPSFMNKYGKKWGVSVSDMTLPLVEAESGYTFHSIPVTEEMKQSVMEGQTMFFKTPNGTVYGWTDGKKIYLTKAGMNPNTKIHEYTHLWARAMMQKNKAGWESVKNLLKNNLVWNEVMNDANYSDIHNNEDLVASEVLSRISGRENAAKLDKMAKQMIDEAKGTMRKAEARGLIQNVKDALNKFWNWVGTELFGIKKFESVEQVTDRVLWDLVNQTDLTSGISEKSSISLQSNENISNTDTANDSGRISEETQGVQGEASVSRPLGENRRLYNPEGEGVSWDDYASFNPIHEREGESDRQRNTREARFYEAFEKLTSDDKLNFYLFVREYFNYPSGALKTNLIKYTEKLRENGNNTLASFAEAFINDELKYREGVSAQAVAYHNFITGAQYRIGSIEHIFNAFNNDKYNGELFDRALKLAKRFGVTVSFVTRRNNNDFFDALGEYDSQTNSIALDASLLTNGNESELSQTMLHELIHSVVVRATNIMSGRAVDVNNQFIDPQSLPQDVIDGVKTLQSVYESIKEDEAFKNEYGYKNLDEMIAEISNPKFRALLKAKKLWKKFLNGICNILGIKDKSAIESDALTEIESALDKIFASEERGELDGAYASYLGLLADGYTLEDLNNLESGDVKSLLTQNKLFHTGIDATKVATETAAYTYDKTVEKNWQEFQRQFQDAYQPVRIAIDAIQQETGNIPIEDYENYLLAQNQSSSRSRVEIDNFTRKFYSPIIKQVNDIIDVLLKSRGANVKDKAARAEAYKDVRTYLIAKHGLERNAYYQNEKGEMRDYSGLTSLFGLNSSEFEEAERQAQEFVDNFEISLGRVYDANDDVLYQSEEVEALWRKINAATDKTLRHSYECGLLSRKQYDEIRGMFEYYIPLRGFDETTAEDVYSYARFEGNRFNPAVKKAEGRTSIADDPLAMIMNMAESEIAQGNKNRAKQALYNYLLNRAAANDEQNTLMQIEDVWYIKTVDAYGNEVYTIATPDHSAGETYDEFEDRMKLLAEQDLAKKSDKSKVDVGMRFQKKMDEGSHYVHLKVNGVEKAIFINGNPKAADAINGTNVPKMGDGMKKVKNVQRLLSSTFTNYSLEFTARNFFRDLIYSHINISVRESNPEYRRKFRKNWRHNNMLTMLSMLEAYKSGQYDTMNLSADEAMFVEFMENGGQTGYTLINSVEAHKKDLEKAIERMRSGIENGGIKDSTIFKYTLGAIELLNEASELVTRYAAYKTSREMGRGVETSISDAKEVTVNFNTKGAQDGTGWLGMISRYLGAVKYFFNASVQGVQNIKAMAEANKGKFCTTVGGIMGLGILMPVIQGALWEMLGGDDDENWYWNIPEYERQNNLCFVIGNGKYAKIPLPIGFREMYGIGDIIAGGLWDKKFTRDVLSVSVDVANKISTIVLPINPLEGSANGLSLIESAQDMIMPDATQGMIQNRTNKDWKGAPIQKEYTYNEDDPQWTKAFASNPSWLTGLSKWCYENIVIDGKSLDFSPEKLDNTLNNLFGGIYSLTKKTGRAVSMIWNEEERNLSNVPLVGVIIGSGIDKDDRFVNSTYWEMDEYFNDRIYLIKNTAKRFGLGLDDVFARVPYGEARAGEHNPKMSEIYNRDNFEFMQEWYLGHKGEGAENEYGEKILGLDQIRNKIDGINDKINKTEDEDIKLELAEEVVALNNLYETTRRDLVNYLLKLD